MKDRSVLALLAFAAIVLGDPGRDLQASPKPTPTPADPTKTTPSPAAKPTRKLGGGSFGQPGAATPVAGSRDTDSLADVARKAQVPGADPAGTPGRRIVITNESLRQPEPTPAGKSITITGTASSKPVVRVPPAATPSPGPMTEYRDAAGRTEAEWRHRASAARERIERSEASLAAAKEEARRLENDFYAWSDGNYRERVIRPAWDQARERVRELEERAAKARADLDGLEEEARKSGTPPGWLR